MTCCQFTVYMPLFNKYDAILDNLTHFWTEYCPFFGRPAPSLPPESNDDNGRYFPSRTNSPAVASVPWIDVYSIAIIIMNDEYHHENIDGGALGPTDRYLAIYTYPPRGDIRTRQSLTPRAINIIIDTVHCEATSWW